MEVGSEKTLRSVEAAGFWRGAVNLPNLLTLVRILLIPIFVIVFTSAPERAFLAAVVFALASLTDWLDGYLARRRGEITRLGKLLDPFADKLLVASALILLVDVGRAEAWIAIVIIARELAVTGLRTLAVREGTIIPADAGGKAKMIMQTLSIILLTIDVQVADADLYLVGTVALWMAMILSVVSGVKYGVWYWKGWS